MRIYESIDKEERIELEEAIYEEVIINFRQKELEDGCYLYKAKLANIEFQTELNDIELRKAVTYAVELLEELKIINNNGMDKESFMNLIEEEKRSCKDGEETLVILSMDRRFATERLLRIKKEIGRLRRVGGAYWLFISHPGLVAAIFTVYEIIVDRFDDQEMYDDCAYFLLRAIMKVGADGIK